MLNKIQFSCLYKFIDWSHSETCHWYCLQKPSLKLWLKWYLRGEKGSEVWNILRELTVVACLKKSSYRSLPCRPTGTLSVRGHMISSGQWNKRKYGTAGFDKCLFTDTCPCCCRDLKNTIETSPGTFPWRWRTTSPHRVFHGIGPMNKASHYGFFCSVSFAQIRTNV